MLSKEKMREKLRELGAVPPADATSEELALLLRRVKALKEQKIIRPPEGRRAPPASPLPAFTPQPVTTSPGTVLVEARISDHRRRPHDPMAGW